MAQRRSRALSLQAAAESPVKIVELEPARYPIHDRDFHLEFVLGMWFNTRHLVGKPTPLEATLTLRSWPAHRRAQLLATLTRNNQLQTFPSLDLEVAA